MEGFEPPKAEPESAVLPLHYIPINLTLITLLNHKKTVNTYFNKNVNLHKTIYIFVLFIGDSNE